jgi:hypothetical protein
MPSVKISDLEIPPKYLDYVIADIGGTVRVTGLISPADPATAKIKQLAAKEKGDFVDFECSTSMHQSVGGIAEVQNVDLIEEPAGLRFHIVLKKQ